MTVALMNQYIYISQIHPHVGARLRLKRRRVLAESAPTSSVDTMSHQDRETGIPGTEIVYRETDDDSTSSQELLLIPSPTDKPDDPLVSTFSTTVPWLSHSTGSHVHRTGAQGGRQL